MEEWQHPYVNVFKHCGVEANRNVVVAGKCSKHMDDATHKTVFRISGSIPAVNYIKLPKDKALNLHGRFCYLQVMFKQDALFVIHLEAMTTDSNTCRVSIGNVKAGGRKKKAGCTHVMLDKVPAGWTLLSIDLAAAVAAAEGARQAAQYSCLKSIQLCSTLTVRGAFTSDIRFGLKTLPRELVLSHCQDASQFDQLWIPAEPAGVPEPDIINRPIKPSHVRRSRPQQLPGTNKDASEPAAANQGVPALSETTNKPGMQVKSQPQSPAAAAAAAMITPTATAAGGVSGVQVPNQSGCPPVEEVSGMSLLLSEPSVASPASSDAAGDDGAVDARNKVLAPVLQPDPYMALQRVNGYTGDYARSVLYSPATDELVFPAGSVVVAMAARTSSSQNATTLAAAAAACSEAPSAAAAAAAAQGSQRFFLGHTAFVCCLALGGSEKLLVTGQEGKQALIRVWDFSSASASATPQPQQQPAAAVTGATKGPDGGTGSSGNSLAGSSCGVCLAVLCAHASHLAALDVSDDGHAVAAVGCDEQARQMIALWDISGLRQGKKAQLLVQHVTNYNVRLLKFSPFEEDHLLTAGRDSIRCYRLKSRQLRGISIKLQAPLNKAGQIVGSAAASIVNGPKIFTDIAFETAAAALQLPTQHVYVASAAGAVFQVDYASRQLVAVYQLHVGAINSLAIGAGVAVTGADDRHMRLWPLDFRAYLLEAEYESPVTSVRLSGGGLGIITGCEDGIMGLLDVVSRKYTTLLRSHCGAITSLTVHHERPECCTTSADGSVRIWDISSHQQLYEFDGAAGPGRVPSCAAYSPSSYQLAVGTDGGLLRVFDVATTALLQEHQQHHPRQHSGSICQLVYTHDGSYLLSCGADGTVTVYDVKQDYVPVQTLPARPASHKASSGRGSSQCACIAASTVNQLVAVSQWAAASSSSSSDAAAARVTVVLFDGRTLEKVRCIETSAQNGFTRLKFSCDGLDLWALTTQTSQPHPAVYGSTASKHLAAANSADASAKRCTCDTANGCWCSPSSVLMRFSVLDGALLQVLPAPHGPSGLVTSFDLPEVAPSSPQLLVTGGTDHLVKVWAVPDRQQLVLQQQQQQQQQLLGAAELGEAVSRLPPYQNFAGHLGAVTGVAVIGRQMVTAGQDGNIAVWNLHRRSAAGSTTQQQLAHPDINVTLRTWLDTLGSQCPPKHPESGALAAAGPMASTAVPAAAMASPGTGVFPLPHCVHGSCHHEPINSRALDNWSRDKSSANAPAAVPALAVRAVHSAEQSCGRVIGLNAAVPGGVLWLQRHGLLAYPAGSRLVLQHLANHHQLLLDHHQTVTAVVASTDEQLIATATGAGGAAGSSSSEICVWDIASRSLRCALRQHPFGCHLLAFSADSCWLASVGGKEVVVWNLDTGAPTAIGKTKQSVCSLAWLPLHPVPQFITAGGDGLLLWSLQPQYLEQRQLTLPAPECMMAAAATTATGGEPCTAVATAASSGSPSAFAQATRDWQRGGNHEQQPEDGVWMQQAASTAFVSEESGAVWQLTLGGGRVSGCAKVAQLPAGEAATHLQWSQPAAALVIGTSQGRMLRVHLAQHRSSSGGGGWQQRQLLLDGPITTLQLDPQLLQEGVVGCGAGTVWYVHLLQQQMVPLLAAHTGRVTQLKDLSGPSGMAPAAPGDKHAGLGGASSCCKGNGLVASVTEDGWLALWKTDSHQQVLPVVELCCGQPVTSVAWLPGCTMCVLGYVDGHMALLDLAGTDNAAASAAGSSDGGGRLQHTLGTIRVCWSVARHAAPVISLVVHPDKQSVLAASRDGLLTITDVASGQLVTCCQGLTDNLTPLHALEVQQVQLPQPATGADNISCGGWRVRGSSNGPSGAAGSTSSMVAAAAWLDCLMVVALPWKAQGPAHLLASYKCPEVPDEVPAVRSAVGFLPHAAPAQLLLFTSPCLCRGTAVLMFDYGTNQPLRLLQMPGKISCIATGPTAASADSGTAAPASRAATHGKDGHSVAKSSSGVEAGLEPVTDQAIQGDCWLACGLCDGQLLLLAASDVAEAVGGDSCGTKHSIVNAKQLCGSGSSCMSDVMVAATGRHVVAARGSSLEVYSL